MKKEQVNTQPARGMRDFLPADVRKREYVIGIIKEVYESYGFEPLETPTVENIETLMGKYGEEGNQLIYKILKRGEKLEEGAASKDLADLALRYDLTVPLARVVAHHRSELPKFFKRYQIQPVWRADRPAKGRYREFYQCDVDAIGSDSMVVEAEIFAATSEILEKLRFADFTILLNHRDILYGMLEICGIEKEKQTDALIILDKLDKIGNLGVIRELEERDILSSEESKELFIKFATFHKIAIENYSVSPDAPFIGFNPKEREKLNIDIFEELEEFLKPSERGRNGIFALKEILKLAENTPSRGKIEVDPNLARGLSYYTGAISEIVLFEGFKGSIAGGGRYDGLIGMFGKEKIPACGISIGLERILVVMEDRGLFPPEIAASTSADVMVTIWNEESVSESLKLATELRAAGLRVLVYPEADKLGKQFKYAGQIGVPYVCVIGESELADGTVTVKNMETGEQETVSRDSAAAKITGK